MSYHFPGGGAERGCVGIVFYFAYFNYGYITG